MKFKKQVTITEITQEDLVNLFSTALYGSTYLDADYPKRDIYEEDDCYEDKLAKVVYMEIFLTKLRVVKKMKILQM